MKALANNVTIPKRLAVLILGLLLPVLAALGARAQQGDKEWTQESILVDGTIYVDGEATGANDGTSWGDAYTDLQDALDAAVSDDEIWVAEGTYRPTVEHGGSGARYRSFQLVNGVGIYGGFDPSVGDVAWEDRDWQNNVTVASGDIGIGGDPADNAYHVFYHPSATNLGSTAILDGFTITGGRAYGDDDLGRGGGMYNGESSPTLANCTFSENAAWRGGGMSNDNSSPSLTNCTFEANLGGGMYNYMSSPTLTKCAFTGHLMGGMYNKESSPTLTDCAFSNNSIIGDGGGMYNGESSSPVLTNCTFVGNSADNMGGGMYNYQSSPTLANCTFTGNTATYNGGGMANSHSSPTLATCIFSGNEVGRKGGGVYNWFSESTLTNCTFFGNQGSYDYDGWAMFNEDSYGTAVTNCILWGDAERSLAGYSLVTYSDVNGGAPGEGNIDEDPMFVDADNGDFHLLADSPCIDAGDNDAPNLPLFDFEGEDRIEDRDGDGTATVDMGADEVAFPIEGLVASNNSPKPVGRLTTLAAVVSTGRYVSYSWAFGDGEIGTGPVVGHVYAAADTYTAVVTATNSVSQMADTTTVLIFEPEGIVHLPLALRNAP